MQNKLILQPPEPELPKSLPEWPPGRGLPGGPRRPQEAPRAAQDGPKRRQEGLKTAPRATKSAPRAAQRRSQSGLGGHLGPTWRPKGPRRPLRGSFFEASGEQAQAQGARRKTQRASASASAIEAILLKVPSPRCLKPWMAAAGREAMRIKV